MATRLYLPSTGVAPVSPAFSAWTETTGADYLLGVVARINSAMTNKVKAQTATAANSTSLWRAYLFGPVDAQTIGAGTIKGTLRVLESAVNDNVDACRIVLRAVSNNGTTFRSPVIYGPANSTVAEFNTALRAKRLATGGATSAVTTSQDDWLFLEIGYTNTTIGTSISATASFGDDSGTDLGDNETDTSAFNPFVELSSTVTFATAAAKTPKSFTQALAPILAQ